MKTKEQLADSFAKKYRNTSNIYHNNYEIYLAGYEAAQPKWISVEEELPDNDRTVLVYLESPNYNRYKLGAYINKGWYCTDGIASNETVKKWFSFPAIKLKTDEK